MKNRYNKLFAIIAVISIAFISLSYSFAYLVWSNEKSLVNLFTKSVVDIEIVEEFDGDVKKNVAITNDGNIEVYIRVRLNPSWLICDAADLEDDQIEENCETLGIIAAPVDIEVPDSWIYIDGYYYYKEPLAVGAVSDELVGDEGIPAPVHTDPLMRYKLDVVSSSIQANPSTTVENVWNVEVVDQKIVGAR